MLQQNKQKTRKNPNKQNNTKQNKTNSKWFCCLLVPGSDETVSNSDPKGEIISDQVEAHRHRPIPVQSHTLSRQCVRVCSIMTQVRMVPGPSDVVILCA